MLKNVIITVLFLALAAYAALFHMDRIKQKSLKSADDILLVARTPGNLDAARIIGEMQQEMNQWSMKVKKSYMILSACDNSGALSDLTRASTEVVLHKITDKLEKEIGRGNLKDRENVVFAFSGAFSSWLLMVKNAPLLEKMGDVLKKKFGLVNDGACEQEEIAAYDFISEMQEEIKQSHIQDHSTLNYY